jgi:cellobiose phosphorylase
MFDSYSNIRAHDSHGDVVYWCIIALGSYIKVTGDVGILEDVLPYYHDNGAEFAEKTPISEHLHRLLNLIIDSFLPGTALVPFGGGDWNDSLQPVSKKLASRMISSWTVEMNFQAFNVCKMIFELTGNNEKAEELAMICQKIKTDFNKYLVKDGVVAGYGLVEKNNTISLLLHPDDSTTGIHYSILPMERGILSGIFTKDQALHHQQLIEMHLKGPDGARLMDRPLQYKGGVQTMFQRAESSTFFGREIGLMYMHEHIRYAELLAVVGEAEAFMKALRQAIPVAYRDIVPCGDVRQSNCYYSSSDVVFKSRYEADQRYDEIKMGNLSVKGGWRVYSSGPGIFICLIVNHLLGLRLESGNIILDPVMPFSMDGFSAGITFLGRSINIHYRVINQNYGPERIAINGKTVPFSRAENQYRKGGAYMPKNHFYELLNEKNNILEITL